MRRAKPRSEQIPAEELATGSARPSKDFGQTPAPEDGSIAPCPSCINGKRRVLLFLRSPCPDCFGSGMQGYGHSAITVFEEWIEKVPERRDTATSPTRDE
jgi:hypothetical protein